MPFDASGNFSRLYDFEQDRNNGIKILASRVDGEFDNFASGMNLVFFRSGIVAMTGDLNMGLNRITGLSDGAAANPALKWNSDPLTGVYMAGYGRLGISTGGTQRATFDSTGMALTGAFSASGQIVSSGLLSGNSLTVYDANFGLSAIGGNPIYTADAGGDRIGYNRALDFWDFQVGGTSRTQIAATGLSVSGTLSATGAITQNGAQVWHTGNLNPANYAPLAGAVFSGQVDFRNNVTLFGPATAASGNGANLRLRDDTGSPRWLIGMLGTAGATNLSLYNIPAATEVLQLTPGGALTTQGGITAPAIAATGSTMTVSGNQVWHAGNLNPALYAALSGATFTGALATNTNLSAGGAAVNGGSFNRVISVYNSANAAYTIATDSRQMQIGTIGADATTALGIYDATAAQYRMKINTSGVADFPFGLTRGGGQVAYDGMARASARITDGTAAPTGGSNGDLYFQYT